MGQMVNSAVRILEFRERFMITPVEISNSYLSSIETEMDNSYWEEFGRMDNRMKFDWLQKTYYKLTFKDCDGDLKYEVFSNPTLFSMNGDRPAQAMEIAMLNLEPFIREEQEDKTGQEQ